jgi:hypothetical protein
MQAASVAVNQPKTLPPMMMKGVSRAGTATMKAAKNSRSAARG